MIQTISTLEDALDYLKTHGIDAARMQNGSVQATVGSQTYTLYASESGEHYLDRSGHQLLPWAARLSDLCIHLFRESLRAQAKTVNFADRRIAHVPLACFNCKQPFGVYRKRAPSGCCGDCQAHGVSLKDQPPKPVAPPMRAPHWEAWATPSYEGEG